jgi:hypothetical protein
VSEEEPDARERYHADDKLPHSDINEGYFLHAFRKKTEFSISQFRMQPFTYPGLHKATKKK